MERVERGGEGEREREGGGGGGGGESAVYGTIFACTGSTKILCIPTKVYQFQLRLYVCTLLGGPLYTLRGHTDSVQLCVPNVFTLVISLRRVM